MVTGTLIVGAETPKDAMPMTRIENVVQKVKVLRKYSATTGFKTTKSQNDLLQSLDGDDLALALLQLEDDNDNSPKR
jgi:hypothetical protein